jgi:hypothetical protein
MEPLKRSGVSAERKKSNRRRVHKYETRPTASSDDDIIEHRRPLVNFMIRAFNRGFIRG